MAFSSAVLHRRLSATGSKLGISDVKKEVDDETLSYPKLIATNNDTFLMLRRLSITVEKLGIYHLLDLGTEETAPLKEYIYNLCQNDPEVRNLLKVNLLLLNLDNREEKTSELYNREAVRKLFIQLAVQNKYFEHNLLVIQNDTAKTPFNTTGAPKFASEILRVAEIQKKQITEQAQKAAARNDGLVNPVELQCHPRP